MIRKYSAKDAFTPLAESELGGYVLPADAKLYHDGAWHSLGVSDCNLYVCGTGATGNLGLGSIKERLTFTNLCYKTWESVACGSGYALAIDTNGYLYAWGINTYGQLGLGDKVNRSIPTKVGDKTWKSVACGAMHSLAIDTDGYLYAWGSPGSGALGLGKKITERLEPTKVGNKTWKSVACGEQGSCAIDTKGDLYSWGDAHRFGDSGNGSIGVPIRRTEPTKLMDGSCSLISCGFAHYLAVKSGSLYAWGSSIKGALGIAGNIAALVIIPSSVSIDGCVCVSCGYIHSAAIDRHGYLYTWGNNAYGQLGLDDTTDRNTPNKVGDKTWKSVSCGYDRTLAIDTEGYLYAWGNNAGGALGLGDKVDRSIPTKVGDKTWKSVSCYTCSMVQDI